MPKPSEGSRVFVNEIIDSEGFAHSQLQEAGCEVILGKPFGQFPGYTEEEMIRWGKEVDVFMGGMRDPYTRKVIEGSDRLQLIAKYGRGVEKIDLKAADETGVLVCNAPIEENTQAVAEHTIALMLALMKRLKKVESHLKGGGWRDFTVEGLDLSEKTIGFVGFGKIGQAVSEKLQSWGMTFLFYDPFVEEPSSKKIEAQKTSLDDLLRESDIVTIHAAATPENHHLLNKDRLQLMKNSAYLINTSRGELIDEWALVEALQENSIAGAGLDVFEMEPPAEDHPLMGLDEQVILTPHTAGWTPDSKRSIAEACVKNILAVLNNELPPFLVNHEALPIWRKRFDKKG